MTTPRHPASGSFPPESSSPELPDMVLEDEELARFAHSIAALGTALPPNHDSAAALAQLRAEGLLDAAPARPVGDTLRSRHTQPQRSWMSSRARWVTAVSSAIVLLLVIGLVPRFTGRSAHSVQQFHTQPGQRSTLRLADGSTMILAPATTVTVDGSRNGLTLDISGEAYLSMTPHTSRSTVVRTHNAIVRVLGTRFVVRQYPDEPRSRVLVEDGRVALQSRGQHHSAPASNTVLSARMMALVSDSGLTVTSGVTTHEYTAWTNGVLVFRRVPLRDVVIELGRAYGATIQVDDSVLAKRSMILDLPVSDLSLMQALEVIGQTVDAGVVFDGRTYLLSPGYTSKRTPQGVRRTRVPQMEKTYGR